jgi:Rps23 Pro-64 3,4-dihydroxylase Tpa1-like proline 4-hydroxylase
MVDTSIINYIEERINTSIIEDSPFKHILIHDFLPLEFAEKSYIDLLQVEKLEPDNSFISDNGLKREYKTHKTDMKEYNMLMDLFSKEYLLPIIESKFGLNAGSLYSDSSYDGGGYVISPSKTYLRYHVDFNFSSKLNKYRCVNMILYMNKNYKDEYGGQLHLLDNSTKTVEKTVKPEFNTAVIFLTNSNTPRGVSINNNFERRSINVYYYSDEPLIESDCVPHKTIWL